MASTITAGNATNSGLIVSPDNTGAFEIKTGSGAGTTAISIDSSQAVTMPGNLNVTGTILQNGSPPVPQIQTQTLSSGSGSWSKPTTGGYQFVQIEIWAGGGSGGKSNVTTNGASGGGGGAYNTITVPL